MAQNDHSDREKITVHELLEQSARSAINTQREDGSFPSGRNYTYNESETPVRTTSHWAITLSKVHNITGEQQFADAANAAVDYLLSEEARPYDHTFHSRNAANKDKCNGLVGQAVPIRALAYAGAVLGRDDAFQCARDVFMLHPFDANLGLWERIEIDGKKLSFDRTLNHQILFAAAGCQLISKYPDVTETIGAFLDKLHNNMRIHPDGLIKHYIRPTISDTIISAIKTPRHYLLIINEIVFHYYSQSDQRKKKERGYQTVNLEPLSRIKKYIPNHSFWDSEKMYSALKYIDSFESDLLNKRGVSHGYLLQGVAIGKIKWRFDMYELNEFSKIVSSDLEFVLDEQTGDKVLNLDSIDGNTKRALIVRLVDLPNFSLNSSDINYIS